MVDITTPVKLGSHDYMLQQIIERLRAGGGLTAAEILALLLTVDGSGSGLDADLFDGFTSNDFIKYEETSTANIDFVIDEDSFASNSATKVPTQQSVKAYVDASSASADNTAYGVGWDGSLLAPTQNTVYDKIETVVASIPVISDVAYDQATWNANTDAPSKNAVRDKFESLVIPVVSDVAYDATSWNTNTDAPTKNAVRDKIEALVQGHVAAVKDANYTIVENEDIGVDSTGGAFTVELKASPVAGDYAIIRDVAQNCGTAAVLIDRNGSTINGAADDESLDIDSGIYWFIYDGSTWLFTPITPGGLNQTEVDARVVEVASGRHVQRFYVEGDLQQISAGNPAVGFQTLGDYSCKVYDLPNAGFPAAAAKWKPPDNWDAGNLRYRYWWTPSSTNTGNLLLQLNSTFATDGEIPPNKVSEGTLLDAGAGAIDTIQTSAWSSTFTVSGAGIGDFIFFELFRDAANGSDTFTGTAYLIALELEFYTDSPTED